MTALDCEAFYRERDRRTVEYLSGTEWATVPVGLAIDADLARTRSGQVALLALVNMAARVHRVISVAVPPDIPLRARTLVPAGSLADAVVRMVQAIDPCGLVTIAAPRDLPTATVSIGALEGVSDPLYIGADGLLATIGEEPQLFDSSDETLLGAALAACLGAAALLGLVTGHSPSPARTSLSGFTNGASATRGPGGVPVLADHGRVLVVGAGAVASGLGYWVREIGSPGDWAVVDRDVQKLLNTNRSIGTVAAEAGWPDGAEEAKAEGLARLIGARPIVAWYDEWNGTEPDWPPDVVLPLANDRGVRRAIGGRGEERLVHSTTSRDFTAELHRHVADRDDCIVCRLPGDVPEAPFACSTAPLPIAGGETTDAALPFLSAAAGLLLAYALTTVGQRDVDELVANHVQLYLAPGEKFRFRTLQWPPRDSCSHVLPAATRARIAARKTADWGALKPSASKERN